MRRSPQMRVTLGTAGVLVAAVAILVIARSTGAADGRPLSGADLYARLALDAAAGDAEAVQYQQQLDDYLAANALRASDLSLPAANVHMTSRGVVDLRITDSAPWGISISNDTLVDSPEAIASYRDGRHEALAALSVADADRQIRVVVAPAKPLTLPEVADILPPSSAVEFVIADIYTGDGGWLMSSGRSLFDADLAAAPDKAEREILDQASVSLHQFSKVDPSQNRAQVRSLRLSVSAADAVALSLHPNVLIVDPLTDIAGEFAGDAAVVEINNAPDLWEAYARLVLKEAIDHNLIQPDGPDN